MTFTKKYWIIDRDELGTISPDDIRNRNPYLLELRTRNLFLRLLFLSLAVSPLLPLLTGGISVELGLSNPIGLVIAAIIAPLTLLIYVSYKISRRQDSFLVRNLQWIHAAKLERYGRMKVAHFKKSHMLFDETSLLSLESSGAANNILIKKSEGSDKKSQRTVITSKLPSTGATLIKTIIGVWFTFALGAAIAANITNGNLAKRPATWLLFGAVFGLGKWTLGQFFLYRNLKQVKQQGRIGRHKSSSHSLKKEVESLFNEGTELYENEEFKKAEEKLRKALKLMPTSEDTMYNLALVYIELKQYDQARQLVNKIAGLDTKEIIRELRKAAQ